MRLCRNLVHILVALFCILCLAAGCGSAPPPTTPPLLAPSAPEVIPPGCLKDYEPNYFGAFPLCYWRSTHLKVCFVGSSTVTLWDNHKLDLAPVALAGFREWGDAIGSNVITVDVVKHKQDADVVVRFGTMDHEPRNGDILGFENNGVRKDGSITTAKIQLNSWDRMTDSNIYSFQETAAHEFGHALGLHGHSPERADVMFWAHDIVGVKGLSASDINTMKMLYCDKL